MSEPLGLHELQECLVRLKELYPQLKLKKGSSKPAPHHGARSDSKGTADPFPISLSASITPPPSASRYDVEFLGVALLLKSSILQQPPPADAVSIKVTSPELPHKLKSIIAQQLHDVWAAAAAGRSGGGALHGSQTDAFGLHAVLRHAEQQFVQLITSCPQFVEAYEGVDSNGATQRRYAIVDIADADGTEAVAVAEASPAQMPAETVRAGAAGAPTAAAAGAMDAHLNAPASSSSRGSAAIPPPPEEPTAGSHSVGSLAAASSPTQPQGKPAQTAAESSAAAAAGALGAAATDHQQPQQDGGSQCESRGGSRVEPAAALRSSSTHTHPAQPPIKAMAQQQQQQQQRQQERQPQQQQQQEERQQQQYVVQEVGYTQTGHVTSAGAAGAHQGPTAHTQGVEGQQAAAAPPTPPTQPLQGTQQHAAAMDGAPAALRQQQQRLQAPGRGRGRGLGSGIGRFNEGFGRGLYPGHGGAGPTTAFVGGRAGGGCGVPEVQCAGHELAARDVQAVQRRYGRSFRLQQQQQQEQHQQQQQAQGGLLLQAVSGAAASTDQLQDHHHHQQQQQQFVGNLVSPATAPSALQQRQAPHVVQHQQEQQQQQQQLQPPQSFSIMLRPTDPLWGAARGPLHVTGTLNPALYPAANSLSLTLNPSRGVAAAETWVLQEALERELQQQAGRPWQLRTVLRWLENYAGSELDRCYQAQQQLFAQDSYQPQQQQQQQQRTTAARQAGRTGGVSRQSTQHKAAGAASAAHRAAAAAGCGASAGVAQAQDRPGNSQGGIRILRATKAAAGQQQQQQQQQHPQQQQQLGIDAALGLRLKPLSRGDAAADSWLSSPGAAAADNRGDSSDGGSSSSGSSDGGGRMGPRNSSPAPGDMLRAQHSCSDNTHGSGSSGSSEDGSEFSSDGERDEVRLHGGGATGPEGPGGWAVSLEGLRLDNVGVVEVVRASLQVSCTRCSSTATLLLTAEGGSRISTATAATATSDPSSASLAAATGSSTGSNARAFEWVGSCSTCQQGQSVLLRPRFVHEGSNVLAGLKAVGCSPLDLLPSVYGATCGDCDAVGALRALQVGVPASRACGHCHRAMGVSIPSVAFIPQGPASGVRGHTRRADGGPSRRSRAAGGGRAGGALVEGTPLPDNGACKHYRHSYRWLRFPCCGARYPCDLCHEEATPDGHDAAWATRMVCGFCSKEQALAPACKHCGKKLATSASQPSGRNTRHWEGGSGCRDTKMLDRRDAAKYRNSKAKTKSAKASRVGPKPWSGGASGTRSS